MVFPCQICSINEAKNLLTKCCKLFVCEECKCKYENNSLQCVCNKPITNKKLCTENDLLFQIVSDYQSKKQKQCDRCSNIAKINCKNCRMVFCKQCEKQLHNAIGYSKHVRQPYVEKPKLLNDIIENSKKKVRICESHKLEVQYVCQCGALLCNQCIKYHKQNCQKLPLKPKSFTQFQSQFFCNLVYRLSQITNYKQSLQNQMTQFSNYFAKQKQAFEITSKAINQQLTTLKRMLEMKMQQNQKKLDQYWEQCERVYKKTAFYLQTNLKNYDDYAKLIQKFAENLTGLDYLDKRVKRISPLAYQSFSFKLNNIEEVRNSILSIGSVSKLWQYQFHENIILNLQQPQQQKKPINMMKRSDLLTSNTPSQLLYEVSQNPLNPRIVTFNSSHCQIQFSFLHLPYHNFKYEIQYGVGFKMKGKEVFKKIENTTGKGIIQGLNASTKYRIRMRVSSEGEFGQIYEVSTLDQPKFLIQTNNIAKNTSEYSFQFLKQGTIYGTNQLLFGVHYWSILLNSQKSSYEEAQTACITIGLSTKQKKPSFIGSTFNYGYQRDQIIVKVTVNVDDQIMTISNSQNPQSEQKFSLQNYSYPIYPAIQNKNNATVHIKYSFGKDENI